MQYCTLQPKTDSIAKILQQSNVIDLTSLLLRVVLLYIIVNYTSYVLLVDEYNIITYLNFFVISSMMSSKRSWQLLIIIIKEKRTMIFGERKNVKNSASLFTFKETEI